MRLCIAHADLLLIVVDVFTCWKLEKAVSQCIFVEGDDVHIPDGDLHPADPRHRISGRYFQPKRTSHGGVLSGCLLFIQLIKITMRPKLKRGNQLLQFRYLRFNSGAICTNVMTHLLTYLI